MTTASVSGSPSITATVTPGGSVSAGASAIAVSSSTTPKQITFGGHPISASTAISPLSASVQSGPGPAGPQGPAGERGPAGPPAFVSEMEDVLVDTVVDGDLLRYSDGYWRNHNETLITDGGNF